MLGGYLRPRSPLVERFADSEGTWRRPSGVQSNDDSRAFRRFSRMIHATSGCRSSSSRNAGRPVPGRAATATLQQYPSACRSVPASCCRFRSGGNAARNAVVIWHTSMATAATAGSWSSRGSQIPATAARCTSGDASAAHLRATSVSAAAFLSPRCCRPMATPSRTRQRASVDSSRATPSGPDRSARLPRIAAAHIAWYSPPSARRMRASASSAWASSASRRLRFARGPGSPECSPRSWGHALRGTFRNVASHFAAPFMT